MTDFDSPPIQLKNPRTAALLAWLVPGLGHLYQGRTAKGLLYMVCLVPMFLFGLYAGGGKVVYASPQPVLPNPIGFITDRWYFPCQAGIGMATIPALWERAQFRAGKGPSFGGVFYPPRTGAARGSKITSIDSLDNTVTHPTELAKWQYDYGFFFELGSIYAAIAGLLNILVVYDAHSGPMIVPEPGKEKKAPEEK